MIIFCVGIGLMIVAPLLRRYNKAWQALAAGAFAVIAFSVIGLVHVDPKVGEAAIHDNRREYLFFMVCEIPVLILGLISRKGHKWAFWTGWGINMAVSLFVLWAFIELEFFWHW